MLRQLMWSAKTGDQDFLAMMQDFVKSYTNKNASTEDFREVVNRHMKPDLDLQHNGRADWFFREWVYGSEIPRYHFEYSLAPGDQGKVMLTGKVTQSGVSTNFVMPVPVYADFDGNMVRLGSVALQGNQTSKEFKVMLPKKPKRLLVNAHHDVLAAENTVSGN
jgi:aminopeptidase N